MLDSLTKFYQSEGIYPPYNFRAPREMQWRPAFGSGSVLKPRSRRDAEGLSIAATGQAR